MRNRYISILIFLFLFYAQSGYGQIQLKLDTPVLTTKIFAANIISTNLNQRDIAISPDGSEIYYTIFNSGFDGNIYFIKKTGDQWSLPAVAPFSGADKDLEPAFAFQGNRLYFSSSRSASNYNIWYVERENNGVWSSPINIGSPVNTSKNEFYPSVTKDGSIYYTAEYSHGFGGEDIWYSQLINGVYQTPIPLENVNSEADEFNAFVDPNERYIYFGSFGRPDGFGGGDIYTSTMGSNNTWGEPRNLGEGVNSNRLDYSPFVSSDGRYLFFTSERGTNLSESSTNPFDSKSVIGTLLAPNTFGSNIYWKKR